MKKKQLISNENLLMAVLAFMCFSIGVWGNYRQLWLQSNGFDFNGISKLFSVALICSAVISFIISLFSYKIKIKSVILMSIILRCVSLTIMLFIRDSFVIKTCILLCIMCEVIFSIAFYPLLTFITKTDASYKKKTLIDYFSKDIGIVSCGLLIGVSIGNYLFDYDTCLIIALFASIISVILLFKYNSNEKHNKNKPTNLVNSFKKIVTNKINKWFLISELVVYIAYGIVFDLMMLILTNYINFEVAFASVFIIVCNVLGSICATILAKYSDKMSISLSSVIKFGTRSIGYILAFIFGSVPIFIAAIVIAFVTSRILEDKVTGSFLKIIDKEDQFLYGNIRYFIVCIGEGIGAFLAGVLISGSIRYLFLGAGIMTLIQTIMVFYLDIIKTKMKK